MWLVVGLGNPGPEYEGTRHNLGFRVVDELAARAGAGLTRRRSEVLYASVRISRQPVTLLKPLGYMNRSGEAVQAWLQALGLGPDRLVVVHDDLDLPLGRLRIVPGGRSAGHRGVQSIQDRLGTQAFARVRMGIGRPPEAEGAVSHVLAPFIEVEAAEAATVSARAADAVETLLAEGLAVARNRFNARPRGVLSAPRAAEAGGRGGGGGIHQG